MSEIKWIRIATSMFGDNRISFIEHMKDGDSLLSIWIKLLLMAGKVNNCGLILSDGSLKDLSASLNRPSEIVESALTVFNKFGMIEWNGTVLKIINPGEWYKITWDCVIGKTLDIQTRHYVLTRDNYICAYCGRSNATTVDHIFPKSRGGSSELTNLVSSCKPCNSSKGARTPEEWRKRYG